MEGRLPRVAAIFAPVLEGWLALHPATLNDAELVAAFILGFLAVRCAVESEAVSVDRTVKRRQRRSWASGARGGEASVKYRQAATVERPALLVVNVPGLANLLFGDDARLAAKVALRCCSVGDVNAITVASIFKTTRLHGTADCVNDIVSQWLTSHVPFVLLHTIPSPLQVLRQQAQGQRVISVLHRPEELASVHVSPLAYMSGGMTHARDALDFLLHDVQHMHMFLQADIYLEQVGFFAAVAALGSGKPLAYFTSDLETKEAAQGLWLQLQYCLSDMNCWATHLVKYLKAKWVGYCPADTFAERWAAFLRDVGMPDGSVAFTGAMNVCVAEISNDEGGAIREHFAGIGARVVGGGPAAT